MLEGNDWSGSAVTESATTRAARRNRVEFQGPLPDRLRFLTAQSAVLALRTGSNKKGCNEVIEAGERFV